MARCVALCAGVAASFYVPPLYQWAQEISPEERAAARETYEHVAVHQDRLLAQELRLCQLGKVRWPPGMLFALRWAHSRGERADYSTA